MTHRSSAMKQFLQNAIQLQLFKQVGTQHTCNIVTSLTVTNHGHFRCRHSVSDSVPLKFIDGRLDLLNAGEGFSDDFEEEINMGEYAGHKHTHTQF